MASYDVASNICQTLSEGCVACLAGYVAPIPSLDTSCQLCGAGTQAVMADEECQFCASGFFRVGPGAPWGPPDAGSNTSCMWRLTLETRLGKCVDVHI